MTAQTFKRFLETLLWRGFDRYPEQGSTIYIHGTVEDDPELHKFVKVSDFNAVTLDCGRIFGPVPGGDGRLWIFTWLPADYVKRLWDTRGIDT